MERIKICSVQGATSSFGPTWLIQCTDSVQLIISGTPPYVFGPEEMPWFSELTRLLPRHSDDVLQLELCQGAVPSLKASISEPNDPVGRVEMTLADVDVVLARNEQFRNDLRLINHQLREWSDKKRASQSGSTS